MRAIITRGLYIFYPIFTVAYIAKRLVLQTIYVVNKEILQFLGLKSTVYNQKRVVIWRVQYTHIKKYIVETLCLMLEFSFRKYFDPLLKVFFHVQH